MRLLFLLAVVVVVLVAGEGVGRVKVKLREQLRSARALAAQQAGLLSQAQLKNHGLNGKGISRLTERGNLVRVLKGVYRLPDAREHPDRSAMAICLWGEDVVVSHRSAAQLLKLDLGPVSSSGQVDVTRFSDGYAPSGYAVRRTERMEPFDILRRGPLRFTQPLRTLLDLADEESEEILGNAFESAWNQCLVSPGRVRRYLERLQELPGRPPNGTTALRAWCDGAEKRERAMQSPLEVRYWLAGRAAELPPSRVQYPFRDDAGQLAPDFAYEKQRVIVEPRGVSAHASPKKLRENARRDARLAAAGWLVLVVTWEMLEPPRVQRTMEQVKQTLLARSHLRPSPPEYDPPIGARPAAGARRIA